MSRKIRDTDARKPGTPETVWNKWGRDFPELSLQDCTELIVIAPHPDDEVLGVGGLIALARANEIPVRVIAVTDGADTLAAAPSLTQSQVVEATAAETADALAVLGVDPPVRLGFTEGSLVHEETTLVSALEVVLEDADPQAWCLTTWRSDGQPDHEATGRATLIACDRLGIRALEYPIWMWHWAYPDHPDVPWDWAAQLVLPGDVHQLKGTAIQQFCSLLSVEDDSGESTPALPKHVLERLWRMTEMVFG
ncbi:PIG-L deacetylase family protein [Saxibacter everestensis]|uniref:PIG-L deacetylase family protein n=1 Tax=Saxibacter everestensis TaxID=2909229 RepID=A0ABY8QSH5_9MICO|nr:PIG-L deacetylase family protein [Brevibacteriaceae bacterium ZFBP1038]